MSDGFVLMVMAYGKSSVSGTRLLHTRQDAEKMLTTIGSYPDYAAVVRDDIRYTVKGVWLEGDQENGQVLVQYGQEE